MVLVDHTGWKLRRRQWTGTTEQLIEQLESTYDNAPNMFSIRIHHGGKFQRYPGRMYVSGRVDIFDMVDIDLFTVVALNMMVLKLGYTGESEPMFYNYLRPLTSLDEGLYALACEEDVRCRATLVRSFKLIEVYIEHGVTVLDSYLGAPWFRETLEDITDEPAGSIAANRTEKMLLLTWQESSETIKELVCDSVTPSSLPQHDSSTPYKGFVCESITPSFVSQQATASQVIDDVMRKLSFDEIELDGEAGFADVAGSGMDSSGLSHDESFGVDDLDLNLNEPILAKVSTQEPIVSEVSTQELIVVEVSTEAPIVEEVGTQEFSVEDVVIEDYSSEDAGTDDDDDDVDEDFLVDEENDIVEPDVDIHLFGISMDLPFDNIGITNLVSDDVLEGEDVDVDKRNYRKIKLAELRMEMEGVINASGQWKYSFYTGQQFTTPKEAKDRVYLHCIKSRRNLKLYKNDSVRIRARCERKVHVFTMSQGTDQLAQIVEWKSGLVDQVAQLLGVKKEEYREIKHCTYKFLSEKICEQVRVNPDIPVKAVQDQLQRELEVQIAMSKAFKAKAKAKREIRGDHCLGDDIDLHPNSNFTFISNRQKGIIPAIKTIYPSAEHRYCLQHIHENMKQGWCGQAYKDLLWRAASATNVSDFKKCMLELKTINLKAHEWLNKIPAEHWARSHFLGRSKSDLLFNNICEVFNGKIVRGRDKLVITLLEYIKEYCMKRIMNIQGVIDKCTGPLTPTATTIMEFIKKEAHLIKVQWNGANKYQVSGLLACWNMALNDQATPPPETWVGRPKKKRKRSKHEDEPFVKDGKLSRKGRTITCQSCGNIGHNKATCKGQGLKATTGGNNAEGNGSASRQAQQTEPAVGQDGSCGSGAGVVIGLSAAAGEGGAGDLGGAGVASQGSSHTRWTRRRVQTERISLQKRTLAQPASQPSTSSQVPVSQTRTVDGIEMGDGVLTQSSAAGGASEWSFL
ncbi:hypothetical protein Tco_0731420 [Tanacetum coccineum]